MRNGFPANALPERGTRTRRPSQGDVRRTEDFLRRTLLSPRNKWRTTFSKEGKTQVMRLGTKRKKTVLAPSGWLHPTPGNTKPPSWAGILTCRHPSSAPSHADFTQWCSPKSSGLQQRGLCRNVHEMAPPASRFTLRHDRGTGHPKTGSTLCRSQIPVKFGKPSIGSK
jgi:hypothetical protein